MKFLTIAFLTLILKVGQNTDATLLFPVLLRAYPRVNPLLPQVNTLLPQLLHQSQPSPMDCQSDQSVQFRNALYDFFLNVYNALSDRVNDHFVTSPLSIWMSLAALAEGADPQAQTQLFKVLGLPQEYCLRQKFYTIALSLETPGPDVTLLRHRGIVFDDGVQVSEKWSNFVKTSKLIEYVFTPMKAEPRLTEKNLRKAIGSRIEMPLQGNSVIIDSLKYRGLWTNAFDAAKIKMEPFYDESGSRQIGTVQMMRIRLQTRIAELPLFKAKVVELPVGNDGRYSMLIGLGMENNGFMRHLANLQHSKIINDVLQLLRMSPTPIEIAIPKFTMSTDYDARVVLERLGITDVWTDPAATRYVSNPPALPGGLVQRVTVKLGPGGIIPPTQDNPVSLLGELANTLRGHDFVANRPFMYVLMETRTGNVLFAGSYSDPNRT